MVHTVQRNGANLIIWEDDGSRRYAIAEPGGLWRVQGAAPGPPPVGDWVFPFPQSSISSAYGPRAGGFHHGTDWALPAAAYQAPIKAIGDGTVVFAGTDFYGANVVMISHGIIGAYGEVISQYAHNDDAIMSVNDTVVAGQTIAHVGYTGYVIPPGVGGAHLHLQVNQNGTMWNTDTIDPVGFLTAMGATGG